MRSNLFSENSFSGGLDMDTDPKLISKDSYCDAKNVRIIATGQGSGNGTLQPIEQNYYYNGSKYDVPTGEAVLAMESIEDYLVLITKVTSATSSKEVDDIIVRRYLVSNKVIGTETIVVHGKLGLCYGKAQDECKISLVLNYESADNIKAYFTDGTTPIYVVNIVSGKYTKAPYANTSGKLIDSASIMLQPSCTLLPPSIQDLINGSLPAGVIQYCYQLFNEYETETALSSLSQTIHLTLSSTTQNSLEYKGSYPGSITDKGCSIRIEFNNSTFTKCRLYSIVYTEKSLQPIISIVNEFNVDPSAGYCVYNDTGQSIMSTLSVEEFNALTGYLFMAQTLCSYKNMLFAANVQEDSWDPDYDARAYRCDKRGKVKLVSSNSNYTITIDNAETYNYNQVPKDHDCINPFNSILDLDCGVASSMYCYNCKRVDRNGNYTLGGYGPNIEYVFVTTDIKLTGEGEIDKTATNNDADKRTIFNAVNVGNTVIPESITQMDIRTVGRDGMSYGSKAETVPNHVGIKNYADPIIASRYVGYQRDEVYRFGIIFYNNRYIPSPVYWIGDIRTPQFDVNNSYVDGNENLKYVGYRDGYLWGNALGIEFKVKSVPAGAVAFEIVRCDRTSSDRSVVMQAALTSMYNYMAEEEPDKPIHENTKVKDKSIEYRPLVFPTYVNKKINTSVRTGILGSWAEIDGGTSTLETKYIGNHIARLISPEICINGLNLEKQVEGCIATCPVVASSIGKNDSSNLVSASTASKALDGDGKEYSRKASTFPGFISSADAFDINIADSYLPQISKYYNVYSPSKQCIMGLDPTIVVDLAKFTRNVPYNEYSSGVIQYKQHIGQYTFTNYSVNDVDNDGTNHVTKLGPAGPSMIITSTDLNKKLYFMDHAYSPAEVPMLTLKRSVTPYGGDSYSSRQNSTYISIGYAKSCSNIDLVNGFTLNVFGGDTFIGILDYPATQVFQANDAQDYTSKKTFQGAYIPFETSVNLNLLQGDMAHMSWREDNFIDGWYTTEILQRQDFHIQDDPYYVYNAVYSSHNGARYFTPKSIYAKSNVINQNRILNSLMKVNNEVTDSWAKFKPADFIDVDIAHGEVTNLKVFKSNLLYFQTNGFGAVAVNDRVLLSGIGTAELTLGTGGVLDRYDYISNVFGNSTINDLSFVTTDKGLYWYDYQTNEILAYGGGQVTQLSKKGKIQSFLNNNTKAKNVVGCYNKKYNEVLFSNGFTVASSSNLKTTLSYSEDLSCFVSFNFQDEGFKRLTQVGNLVIGISGYNFVGYNGASHTGDNTKSPSSSVRFVVNSDVDYTKVFDNVFITNHSGQNNINFLRRVTFNSDLNQEAVLQMSNPEQYIKNREGNFRFYIPRENNDTLNENTSLYKPRMRGHYLYCEYNFSTNDNNPEQYRISKIITTFRTSKL